MGGEEAYLGLRRRDRRGGERLGFSEATREVGRRGGESDWGDRFFFPPRCRDCVATMR